MPAISANYAIGIDRSAEQAAESLGASRFTLFHQITLPMILPGVAGAVRPRHHYRVFSALARRSMAASIS